MRLPNGYGGVVKLSGKRRKPYAARVTAGWHINEKTGKAVQDYQILGYSETKAGALQILAKYNDNPIDLSTMKLTFEDIYNRWAEEKYPTISPSNVNGYKASFALCAKIAHKPFKDIKLDDLQRVVDTCGKNYPTLRKLLVLFHQIYEYALKHELTTKDYSEFVDILKYKDKNPNKADRNRFTKDEIDKIWSMKDDKYYQIILQTTIKKIVGHSGAMTLTEKIYTHMDIGELVKAINLI